jgi:cyclophilin family peptidyl-prolyl cis-trans isomerase
MKTYLKKNNSALVLFIYVMAFVLMTWTISARAESAKTGKSPEVLISTSLGDIKVRLNAEKAPLSTQNFLKYTEKKYFDGTTFHRVIKTFMIQGGGMLPDLKEKDGQLPPIKNEAKNGLSNLRGTISMARTNEVDSATSQFFINVVDNPKLDHKNEQQYGYAVFGEVVEGMNVVDKIRDVATTTQGEYADVPVETVMIKTVRVVGGAKSKKSKKGK